jgi:S-formylglutathione hydrolase
MYVGDRDAWDFGVSAGFYLDATVPKWAANYNMYSYVVEELPEVIAANFQNFDPSNVSIFGHSMGGHGALIIALKNPEKFKSVSAFAPITNPSNCPWGRKAFSGYLGDDETAWQQYDATALIAAGAAKGVYDDILLDAGAADTFIGHQLRLETFKTACDAAGQKCSLRITEGYDHSYYFIATFMEEHVAYHAARLK